MEGWMVDRRERGRERDRQGSKWEVPSLILATRDKLYNRMISYLNGLKLAARGHAMQLNDFFPYCFIYL